MFVGATNHATVEQLVRTVPFGDWGDVYVGCSGTFRIERGIKLRHPGVRIHSNDVSLFSVMLGRLLTGQPTEFNFTGRLEFIEEHLVGVPNSHRLAATAVAMEMVQYHQDNPYALDHFNHYIDDFSIYLDIMVEKIAGMTEEIQIDSFVAGGFLDHLDRCKEAGGGFIAFPPPKKGGYETIYEVLHENVDWEPPDYPVWDPTAELELIESMAESGIRYAMISEQRHPELERTHEFYSYRGTKNYYCYANSGDSSLRRSPLIAVPFRYESVIPADLTQKTKVQVRVANTGEMTFLKNMYLAKKIQHIAGEANFIIFLDGQLAGGFIYKRAGKSNRRRSKGQSHEIYMLCDFSISRERKLSKLIAMISISRIPIHHFETHIAATIDTVTTTAFTETAGSMKYRGVFKKISKGEGFVNYEAEVLDMSLRQVYTRWWDKYARKA